MNVFAMSSDSLAHLLLEYDHESNYTGDEIAQGDVHVRGFVGEFDLVYTVPSSEIRSELGTVREHGAGRVVAEGSTARRMLDTQMPIDTLTAPPPQMDTMLLLGPLIKAPTRNFYIFNREWRVFWSSRSVKSRKWSPYKMHIVHCDQHLPNGALKLECALAVAADRWVRLEDNCLQLANATTPHALEIGLRTSPVGIGYSFRFHMENIQRDVQEKHCFAYNTSHPHSKRPIWFRLVYEMPEYPGLRLLWPPREPQRFAFFSGSSKMNESLGFVPHGATSSILSGGQAQSEAQ